MNLTPTASMMERLASDWQRIAGEKLEIKATSIIDPIYAFCSELGALRLHYKLGIGRASYSEDLQTWYYVNK